MEELKNNIIYQILESKESEFLPLIHDLYDYVESVLPKINNVFDNYTEHGVKHSVRVLKYMSGLIQNVDSLTELELTMIIYCALLHDVGMIVTDDELDRLTDVSVNEFGNMYSMILEEYNGDTKLAQQEFYRPVHGIRSANHINSMKPELFQVPGTTGISFCEEIGDICRSHNESCDWIKNNIKKRIVKEEFDANGQFIAILLRLGDILDIDEKRTPLYVYDLFSLRSFGDLEWKQHFDIDNTRKIFTDSVTKQKRVEFHGSSSDAEVHRKLLSYIDWIDTELEASTKLCDGFHDEKYRLFLKEKVVNRIDTKGFTISDFRLSLDYKAVTGLLMGEKIYGDKRYGLREIIQNSIDACKLMKEIQDEANKLTGDEYSPLISIIFDKSAGEVTIRDNGVGMTLNVLRKYFLNVGVSYYSSSDFKFKGYKYRPIGNYGIGFLACFMLSENVNVKTKHYTESSSNEIEIEKSSEFISLTTRNDAARNCGTEVIFDYDSFLSVFKNDIQQVINFIETNFLIDDIKIKVLEILDGDSKTTFCKTAPAMNEKAVVLDDYLDGIETRISITFVDEEVRNFEQVTDADESDIFIYEYDEDNQEGVLLPIKKVTVSINDFINDDEILYQRIPIIDKSVSSRFESLLEALDDWDEAFDKIQNDIERDIYIFSMNMTELNPSEDKIESGESVVDGLDYDYICENFESDKYLGTQIELVKQRVSHKSTLDSILLVKEKYGLGYDRYDWMYSYKAKKQKIYNKNVYLRNMTLEIPYLASIVNIGDTVINLRDKKVIPNLARDNVDDAWLRSEMGKAIGRAIHLYLLEQQGIGDRQKELIQEILDKYYGNLEVFVSDKIIDHLVVSHRE